MEFEKLITERYSVRSFRPEHLPEDVISRILEAGHVAPTGCNFQPQRILVLNTDESMEKLGTATRCRFGAPTAMLVCHDPAESWRRPYDGALSSPVDAVIVATHMMLAAHNDGVGTCMVMHFDPLKMREAFKIPEGIEPVLLLIMGYPSENAEPKHYHFEYRPMEEVVFHESF